MYYSEWENYAYMARLRTARQKKRLLIKDRDKKLLAIEREFKTIRQAKDDLDYTPIYPPIQKGWKRSFVLRHDVAISKDAAFFENILERINTVQYSHRSDFKKKRRWKGKKIHVEREQRLHNIQDWELYKKPFSEKEKTFFAEYWTRYAPRAQPIRSWVFTQPWRFVLKTEPNRLTHVRNIDPLLEAREDLLHQYLQCNNLWPRYQKLVGGYAGWNDRYPHYRYKHILEKTARQELEDQACQGH